MADDVSIDQGVEPENPGVIVIEDPELERKKKNARLAQQAQQRNRAPLATLMGSFLSVLADAAGKSNGNRPDAPLPFWGSEEFHNHQVFTPPKEQASLFAVEMPGGVKGITDKDSYLFITEDKDAGTGMLLSKGWRAFVVPKDDPGKQREISVTNAGINDSREYRAMLGDGHALVIGIGSAALDGKSIRAIQDLEELHKLVKEKHWNSLPLDGGSNGSFRTGDSWTFMSKDSKTGQISKFTQSENSGFGRLEVIQGKPGSTYWGSDGETEAKPISVRDRVPLPDELKRDAIDLELIYKHEGGGIAASQFKSLSNLIQPGDREKQAQMMTGAAAELNAQEKAKAAEPVRQQVPKIQFPKP